MVGVKIELGPGPTQTPIWVTQARHDEYRDSKYLPRTTATSDFPSYLIGEPGGRQPPQAAVDICGPGVITRSASTTTKGSLLVWADPPRHLLRIIAHSTPKSRTERIRLIAPFEPEVELLDTITGVDRWSAECMVAETGIDMLRFGSAARLASWAGRCPGNHELAGKHRSRSPSYATWRISQ
jgi:hypothetical protein